MTRSEGRETRDDTQRTRKPGGSVAGADAGLPTREDDQLHVEHPGQPVFAGIRLAPGVRDVWSRFLLARLTWILLMTILVTASAGGFLALQKPMYKSQATVAVYPASGAGSGLQPFVMGTEKGVASSGAVLSLASQSLLIPISKLQSGLSINVPVDSDLLQISYSDPSPQLAQSVAETIAQAYVAYRTTTLGATAVKAAGTSTEALLAAVVTDATLPASPDSPNPLLTLGVALILGLCLGIGLALILDWVDDGLRGPLDVQAQANTQLLAQIPAIDRKRHLFADGLVTVRYPNSPIVAAYGNLRTRVLQAAALRHANTLLVTSPSREDKSTIAANLAATLALSGRRVVLVCADLRSGRAQALFGLENRLGVTSVVGGESTPAEALAGTEVPRLQVLSNGPASADPSSVLQSPVFIKLLDRLRKYADFVVIDAPPVLNGADTEALAGVTSMILLVADARVSTRAEVRAAAQVLGHVRERLIGCVLDNVSPASRLSRAASPSVTMGEQTAGFSSGVASPGGWGEHVVVEPVDSVREPMEGLVGVIQPDLGGHHQIPAINGNGEHRQAETAHGVSATTVMTHRQSAAASLWHGSDEISDAITTMPAGNGAPELPDKRKRRRNIGRNEL